MKSRATLLPILSASTACVLGGSMTVATRYTVSQIDPVTFAIWRTGMSFVCLFLIALLVQGRHLDDPRQRRLRR